MRDTPDKAVVRSGVEQLDQQGRKQIRIAVLGYALFAALWIALSDVAIDILFAEPRHIVVASVVKGWLFVLITTALLYGLMRRAQNSLIAVVRREQRLQTEKIHTLELVNALAESSDDAIFAKDIGGRYILFNRAASEFVGKPASEVIGHDDHTIFPAAQADFLLEVNRKVIAGRQIVKAEEQLDTPGGKRVFLATKGPLRGRDDEIIGTFGISRDITARQRIEQDLLKLSMRQRALLNALPDLVWLKDPEGRYIACNPRFEAFFGATEAAIHGKTDFDFVDETKAMLFVASDQEAMRENRAVTHEVEVVFSSDGHRELLHTIKTPLYDENGTLIGVLGIARDLTSMRAAENSLRQQAEEIARHNRELERFNKMMVGRELDMIALKRQVNDLTAELGRPAPYPMAAIDGGTKAA